MDKKHPAYRKGKKAGRAFRAENALTGGRASKPANPYNGPELRDLWQAGFQEAAR